MIHLVAGESALGTLKETSVPGEKFSIDDILMEGPIIDGLKTEQSWTARADYLQRFSIPKEQYLSGRVKRDRILADSLSHDEIVLWFEFDLHCQANLLYYLDGYASKGREDTPDVDLPGDISRTSHISRAWRTKTRRTRVLISDARRSYARPETSRAAGVAIVFERRSANHRTLHSVG